MNTAQRHVYYNFVYSQSTVNDDDVGLIGMTVARDRSNNCQAVKRIPLILQLYTLAIALAIGNWLVGL